MCFDINGQSPKSLRKLLKDEPNTMTRKYQQPALPSARKPTTATYNAKNRPQAQPKINSWKTTAGN